MTLTKNETIKATLKATKEKRTHQTCRVYEVKIARSHLNHETEEQLKRLFLEAKWLYNYILSQPHVFDINYKLHAVPVKVKDVFETRELKQLSSQMRQSVIKRTVDNIRGLARLQAQGHKIGALTFKSQVKSIPLKQYGNTYKILDDNYLRIQGVKQKIRVNGLDQLSEDVDMANATLIHRHGDYYVAITTYQLVEHAAPPIRQVGIDFGLKNQLTLSDGIAIQYSLPITTKLRKLHKKLSRQTLYGKNWQKTKTKLDKRYADWNNIKKDIANKLVHYLSATYGVVCYQDENLKGWQRLWGRKMLSTAIGGIIRTLERKVHTPIEVDRWFPSTQTCSVCGNVQEVGLDERVFICKRCGSIMDRDHNSSCCLLNEGLRIVGTERIELTPVEILTSTLALVECFNSIPYVKASLVVEAGSLIALA
jgi:putative transposase